MEITEVRIKLMEESEDRLRAFCSITIDHCFRYSRSENHRRSEWVRSLPCQAAKMTARCGKCGNKNHMRSPLLQSMRCALARPPGCTRARGKWCQQTLCRHCTPHQSSLPRLDPKLCHPRVRHRIRTSQTTRLQIPVRTTNTSKPPSQRPLPRRSWIKDQKRRLSPKPHFLEPKKSTEADSSSKVDKRSFGDGVF